VIAIVHPTTSPTPSFAPISVWGAGWTLRHTSCGLSCFIAQVAFPLSTFGHRLLIHPAVIKNRLQSQSVARGHKKGDARRITVSSCRARPRLQFAVSIRGGVKRISSLIEEGSHLVLKAICTILARRNTEKAIRNGVTSHYLSEYLKQDRSFHRPSF
jgi:hypothetical protein